MSRIGNKHIDIPAGVTVNVDDANSTITVSGKLGALTQKYHKLLTAKVENNQIILSKKESITSPQSLSSDIVKPQLSVIVPEFLNRKARYGTVLKLFFYNT